jgi:tripartite ATP-independent transporter DctM subunit
MAGVLVALFSLEHLIALARGESGTRMALTILCVSFTLLLLLGVPVAFSIGLSSLATLLYEGLPLAVGFQQMISGMNPFSFLAIPFFIFAGELMMYGGIADRIVALRQVAGGHVRGGLGMSNVLACTLFGGVSGSPVADVSAMGAVLIPQMKKEGYDADYAVNVTTHASLVGALMPTSHNLIIFALAARRQGEHRGADPGRHRAGDHPDAVQPGSGLLVAVKRGYPAGTFPGWAIVALVRGGAARPVRVVLIIIAGILSGAFTATESASVAVLWALFLAMWSTAS